MNKRIKQIQLNNFDARFERMYFEPKPKSGWIRTIREALSMPLSFPAKLLKISVQSVARLEKNEIDETITLKSLRQLAETMGCELHYAIVPQGKSLRKIIEKQAYEKAKLAVTEVNKTMELEKQKIIDSETSIKFLAKEYAENMSKKLWSDDEN